MKFLTVFFALLISSSENEAHIWFPQEVAIKQTCGGEEVEIEIEISTNSSKKVKVHSFALEQSDFTILRGKQLLKNTDTVFVRKNSPLSLKIKYKLLSPNKPGIFVFRSDLDQDTINTIKLSYGQYFITTEDIRAGKEQIIQVSESCQDSIKVIFPYGGTISSATLYSDSTATRKEVKSISYGIMDNGNSMTFTGSEKGRYYVDFGSCHWGGEFWLTVK